jgi:hypothetical protein
MIPRYKLARDRLTYDPIVCPEDRQIRTRRCFPCCLARRQGIIPKVANTYPCYETWTCGALVNRSIPCESLMIRDIDELSFLALCKPRHRPEM